MSKLPFTTDEMLALLTKLGRVEYEANQLVKLALTTHPELHQFTAKLEGACLSLMTDPAVNRRLGRQI